MTAPPAQVHAVHVHASVVVVGEVGLLIEGPSGSGKSSLAAALLVEAGRARRFGRLVGDDRVGLVAAHGRLIAAPHPLLAGLLEQRGTGLVTLPFEPACVIALVVALVAAEAVERLPDPMPTRLLEGVNLPMLRLRSADGPLENSRRVLLALPTLLPQCTAPF